jgi:hypothetical protein
MPICIQKNGNNGPLYCSLAQFAILEKNSKAPQYWTLTKGWMAKEIGRARDWIAKNPLTRAGPMMGQAGNNNVDKDDEDGEQPAVAPEEAAQLLYERIEQLAEDQRSPEPLFH